ncbi:uncharacterized protein DS421_16g566250 [Arachis hypogaea]|nr:uncharacterized protein DS421_16g566250 [Arachis hypogaea]
MRQYRLQSYMIRFLRGLNDQYASVCSHIMLLKPLPDVNTVFSLLLQQERQMMHLIKPDFRMLVNAVHTKSIGEREHIRLAKAVSEKEEEEEDVVKVAEVF